MAWTLELKVERKEWIKNPLLRWNHGLELSGMNFRTALSRSHYPPLPPSGVNVRTYATADKANFTIDEFGKRMSFGSTFYLPFILYSTKFWRGWPSKLDEIETLMTRGFIAGVAEYDE